MVHIGGERHCEYRIIGEVFVTHFGSYGRPIPAGTILINLCHGVDHKQMDITSDG